MHPSAREGMLTLRAEGRYLSDSGAVADPRPRGDEFLYTDEDGEKKRANHVFAVGAASQRELGGPSAVVRNGLLEYLVGAQW